MNRISHRFRVLSLLPLTQEIVIRFINRECLPGLKTNIGTALVKMLSDIWEGDYSRLDVEKIWVLVVEAHVAYAARFGSGGVLSRGSSSSAPGVGSGCFAGGGCAISFLQQEGRALGGRLTSDRCGNRCFPFWFLRVLR